MSLASIYFQKKYDEGTANSHFIEPSECANFIEYLIRLDNWKGNPKDDPLEALLRFVQCVDMGISVPTSILSWMAKAFEKYLRNYTNPTRPNFDEIFGLSGNKLLRTRYYQERDEFIALKIDIYASWLHMSDIDACTVVFHELNEKEDFSPPFLKTKVPDVDRMAQIYRKSAFKQYCQFPSPDTPEFDHPDMKPIRDFLAKQLKSLPKNSFDIVKKHLPSVKFLDED